MKLLKIILTLILALLLNCQERVDPIIEQPEVITKEDALNGIKAVMQQQTKAWNKHDLEGFMQGYWKNDSLKFYGSNGLTLGWENTLANYRKGYPTSAESGTLKFVLNDITQIEPNAYYVMGEYHLKRDAGDADGVFLIIFKYIDGAWKIVADMSC